MPKLTWVGKEKVECHHHEVPYRVLKKEYSYNLSGQPANHVDQPDSTIENNRIIHGDNLEALKSLLPEYEGKINCIYIDPPYNTGEEKWAYNDNVNHPKIKKWLGKVVGKEGEDLSRHDKWLCMMYPRMKLLHRLMANDGVIFISIDDIELANLICICDEIFGVDQKIGVLSWEKKKKGSHLDKCITNVKEYVLVYSKKRDQFPGLIGHINYESETYPCINPGNALSSRTIPKGTASNHREPNIEMNAGEIISSGNMSLKLVTELKIKNNILVKDVEIESEWRYSQSELERFSEDGSLYFTRDLYLRRTVTEPRYKRLKDFLPRSSHETEIKLQSEIIKLYDSNSSVDLINFAKEKLNSYYEYGFHDFDSDNLHSTGWGSNEDGDEESRAIFEEKVFDFPKPSKFIAKLISSYKNKNAIILDSFAGSGTTAHAALKLNKKDGGNRKFILVEMMDYAETITAERVRRVIAGYGDDYKSVGGLGGNFDFYTVGDRLMLENGMLNPLVGLAAIRDYVAWNEGIPIGQCAPIIPCESKGNASSPYWLGKSYGYGVFFVWDDSQVTTLDLSLLSELVKQKGMYIIYADLCTLGDDFMRRNSIIYKKIPRDITLL